MYIYIYIYIHTIITQSAAGPRGGHRHERGLVEADPPAENAKRQLQRMLKKLVVIPLQRKNGGGRSSRSACRNHTEILGNQL